MIFSDISDVVQGGFRPSQPSSLPGPGAATPAPQDVPLPNFPARPGVTSFFLATQNKLERLSIVSLFS